MLFSVILWSLFPTSFTLSLDTRSVQSQALCLPEFDWMSNSRGQSPCLVAGYLLGQCAGGNWNVPANTNASNHYTSPTVQTANGCSCSWAVYNLMQACAFCQGEHFDTAIFAWGGWMTNCTSNLLSGPEPYPQDISIPNATAIPFFALTDPTTWEGETFDPVAAQDAQDMHKPDLTQADRSAPSASSGSSSSSGPNIGAIAGGVAGGVAVLTIIGISIFVCCRQRRSRSQRMQLQRGQSVFSTTTRDTGSPFSWVQRWPSYRRVRGDTTTTSQSLLMSQSPVSAITNSLAPSSVRPGLASQPSNFSGSFSSIPGTIASMSVRSPDSSQVPTVGHNGQSVHFQSMHAHTLSTGSSASNYSQSSRPGMHGRSDSQTSDDTVIRPFHLPQMPAVPELHDAVADDSAARNPSPGSTSITRSGILMTHPMQKQKERLNPPAYSPVSSPEERYFASMAPEALRAEVETSNQETASDTMIDHIHNPTERRLNEQDRREYPADRKR